jgi:hypothetical protein
MHEKQNKIVSCYSHEVFITLILIINTKIIIFILVYLGNITMTAG